MKVALFADTCMPQINGVTNTLSKLIQYFESNKISYKIFAPKYDIEPFDYNIERFFSLKFFLYNECRIAFPNPQRINSALTEFQPNLIHILTEFNMGLTGLYYGRKYRIPTISTYTTNFSQYTDYYKVDFLKQAVWDYMKWFHTQNAVTLCPTHDAQKLLFDHGILNSGIFSRGIDAEKFSPKYRNDDLRKQLNLDHKIAFLYVGRISFEKDLDILCESYKAIRQKYGNQTVLVMTGDGPYLEKFKAMFPKDTIFTGFKKGKELSEIYASCDIFICPSSTETFGNVALEAMASGIPVIGADAGGIGELIQHGDNGLKFKKRDSQELSLLMEVLIENSELRDQLQRNGREYALNKSWTKIFDKLVDIYHEVINERKGHGISA